MRRARGLGVSPGIAIGRAFVYDPSLHISNRRVPSTRIEEEIARLKRALEVASTELGEVQDRIERKLGSPTAGIFSFQRFVIEDPEFREQTMALIRERRSSAESAVHRFLARYRRKLTALDEHMSERSRDFLDLEHRIVRVLQGRKTSDLSKCPDGAVVVARDLTPSQTVTLDKRRVAGFVTEAGGKTSHTAILAKNLGIAAVVGVGRMLHQVSDGDMVIVDGAAGVVVLRPDHRTEAEYGDRGRVIARFEEQLLEEFRDLPPQTRDGYDVALLGNIEFPEEIDAALSYGAGGIGLYRTEYLYLQSADLPDEERQFEAYSKAISMLGDRPLVIRTMDVGADKRFDAGSASRDSGAELNPFLGCRSIRLSLREPQVFRLQLRAILRAAVEGDVRIMFPMISSLAELRAARDHLESARQELLEEGTPHRSGMPVGIMIEVPSAVMIADLLAREVDFFSIGTNDLIQYTLAVDRVNQHVADLYQPTHPAILRMISKLIEVGTEAGIRVSMCGEMSGNVAYAVLLAGLGLREFSVSPASIPEIKKVIRSISMKEARHIAQRALTHVDGREIESYLTSIAREIIPERFG